VNQAKREQATGKRYDAASRLAEFRELRAHGALSTAVTERLAMEAASAFFDRFERRGEYLADSITLLAEISTLEEASLAEPGRLATFPLLVERLSDSFDPRLCPLYDRAFGQMISLCRQLPSGEKIDAALRRFGLESAADLVERKARLRNRPAMLDPRDRERVRKVLVLSRVTLGADVAISSIVLQKAKRSFPQAELVVFGSPKLLQLFGGDEDLRIRPIRYQTEGGLLERIASWLPVVEAVEQETRGLFADEYVLIDPDSRLLQLGLLPALEDESRYFFLESRSFGELGQGSMSRITLRWLSSILGGPDSKDDEILPAVSLRQPDREFGRDLCRRLPKGGSRWLVALSFGAGGNPDKRLADPFEEQLLLRLLERGSIVLLDKGFGEEERGRANRLCARVRANAKTVMEMDETSASAVVGEEELRCHMLTWHGEIGRFAGLIGASDEYIGYDSAGQHIAAALGVPTIDIFTHHASPVFRERWTPCGRGAAHVISQDAPGDEGYGPDAVLSKVLACHKAIQSASVSTR
jgi:ADP-heptose:LPS heptosyltransferase